MRENIWYYMIASHYRAGYISHFNSWVRSLDRFLEATLVIISGSGIGGWLYWQDHPKIWAMMIGGAQLLKLLKPYIPFLKHQNELEETYAFYVDLHWQYEMLWDKIGKFKNSELVEKEYWTLRREEVEHQKETKNFKVPNLFFLERKTRKEWAAYLFQNFKIKLQ